MYSFISSSSAGNRQSSFWWDNIEHSGEEGKDGARDTEGAADHLLMEPGTLAPNSPMT